MSADYGYAPSLVCVNGQLRLTAAGARRLGRGEQGTVVDGHVQADAQGLYVPEVRLNGVVLARGCSVVDIDAPLLCQPARTKCREDCGAATDECSVRLRRALDEVLDMLAALDQLGRDQAKRIKRLERER